MVVNPNKSGSKTNVGEDSWGSVAKLAGKMSEKPTEHQINQPSNEMGPWRQEILREHIKNMAQSSSSLGEKLKEEQTGVEELKADESKLEKRILQAPYTPEQRRVFYSESAEVQSLLKDKSEIDETPIQKRTRKQTKEYQKIVSELVRYGYSKDGSQNSSIFVELENGGIGYGLEKGKSVAQDRQYNYELLADITGGFGKKQNAVKKALKRHGFRKMPEGFDDERFTSYEIKQMVEIAKAIAKQY